MHLEHIVEDYGVGAFDGAVASFIYEEAVVVWVIYNLLSVGSNLNPIDYFNNFVNEVLRA